MRSYAYLVLDGDGRQQRGALAAENATAAAAALRGRGWAILEVRERRAPLRLPPLRPGAWLAGLRPVTGNDLVQFLRQLALMLRSGLPLLHALEVLEQNCGKLRLARAIARVSDAVRQGRSFSAALAGEPRLFPPLMTQLVAAGEASGELAVILDRLAAQQERRAELRASLMTSMSYPALVVLITIGVVAFLVTNVIPKFMRLLAGRQVALPASTRLLVDVSDFLRANALTMAVTLAAAIALVALLRLGARGRLATDRLLLALPLVGRALILATTANFCRTLAILLRSGVPILDGLHLLGGGSGNQAFAAQLRRAEQGLLAGRPLSQGLRAPFIPALVPELVGVGESTGTLDSVLEEAGLHHEQALQRTIRWMTTLFEPAMILVIGGVVGFVYVSFFQVLYQLSAR
ncbi:MAG: type II secretion system F family protein [Planctomycetes bacterium]|nr:type II secretion system F family protein [Planctomycetota bacterium]